jgi:hypothetical protein
MLTKRSVLGLYHAVGQVVLPHPIAAQQLRHMYDFKNLTRPVQQQYSIAKKVAFELQMYLVE